MNIVMLRGVLLYCTIINLVVLALWGLFFLLPHAWLYRLWGRVSRLPGEQLDAINVAGIVIYKLGILMFNLVPYLALRIVG